MSRHAGKKKHNKSQPRKAPSTASMGMIFLGAALILIGVVSMVLLDRPAESRGEEISAVPAQVEFSAPSLTLNDLSGQPHSLRDYLGQIVLVNLWATWCPPCKAEMPTLNAYYQDHRNKGFTLIAINAGDPANLVEDFVKGYNLSLIVWLDPQNQASRAFQVMSYPSSFVIDRQGTVRLAWVGAITRNMLEKYVTPLIGE
uniref:Alkyl hydroperoxide reductase/thiol specific antioxidant/Mal allergen n=1 Tax=uncultured Chloroflexota bacterium TaxID=166587 RepID=H5SL97_9CHLR|nr:alkyl hydroperoxide reductase/thiol specific antioxidant/Mal allergen [uncultured Chloroflexota bacterium]